MKDLVPWTVVEIRLQTALVAKALDPGNLGERSLKFRSAVATFHTTELTPGRRLPVLEAKALHERATGGSADVLRLEVRQIRQIEFVQKAADSDRLRHSFDEFESHCTAFQLLLRKLIHRVLEWVLHEGHVFLQVIPFSVCLHPFRLGTQHHQVAQPQTDRMRE
eukprot:CAMPEP_0167791574 /NCGR_PEP_ID=MMETSP0111_2-20121227/12018_1 /TAXON_ID=91324 /ORGANISM="Lotharella globosa, Strain CCCM811" /LENGTH=163 /DNA_ID=CAMNT_0007684271 /DNA_START=318 /DNA_END=806 /DNA_ORIENTATION=-